jgi:hypothetical protein
MDGTADELRPDPRAVTELHAAVARRSPLDEK